MRHNKEDVIKAAVAEAKRFLAAAEAIDWDRTYTWDGNTFPDVKASQVATEKRASMDLTRALAEVRR